MAVKNLLIKLGLKGDKQTKKALKDVDKSFLDIAKSAAKVAGAFYAAKGVVRGLNEIANISSATQQVASGFNSLTREAGFSANTLDKLTKATDGTVSSLDLMTQANNAMLLGIFESEDQMANMFDSAQRLSAALGQDTLFGVESLVTGLGRQSKLMLDNLGIMVDAKTANENFAESLGKTVESLTDQERKQAFINEALKQTDMLVSQLGEENLTTADRIDMLKASSVNMAGVLGEALTPAFNSSLDLMTSFADEVADFTNVLAKVDFSSTASNIISNTDALLKAVGDTFRLLFDGLPEFFSFSFGKIIGIAQGIFETLVSGVQNVASFLFEPIPIFAELMAAKVRNIFIAMFNFIKEQFNSFADTFIGEKLGIEKLQMTDFIDTEGISAEFGETGLADLFGGEDQVQNLSDFTEKSKEVWANYFATVGELKQANAVLENENALINNETALANQQEFIEQTLSLSEFETNEAIKKINQRAQAFRDAKVNEVDVQNFITAEKSKLFALEAANESANVANTLGLLKKAAGARGADAQILKDLAIGEAIISTYSAAAKAFASAGGFPLGIAPAAASIAFGLAQVSTIMGTKFADGGIVPGTNSGQGDTVPAMLTPGEVILNQAQQENLAGGMGNNITVNISAPLVDETVVESIIPAINSAVRENRAVLRASIAG